MSIRAFACALTIAAIPASSQELAPGIDLIRGHPVYHDHEREAGVAMALSITPGKDGTTNLMELCEELRLAAGLGNESGDELRLETIFVVPYKSMAVEGHYLPSDGTSAGDALVRGNGIARPVLDRILAQAGIPPRILDETHVEHEVSCAMGEPLWFIAWHDVRLIGDEEPDAVVERARQRFMEVYQSVVEHNGTDAHLQEAQRPARGG